MVNCIFRIKAQVIYSSSKVTVREHTADQLLYLDPVIRRRKNNSIHAYNVIRYNNIFTFSGDSNYKKPITYQHIKLLQ